jgi:pantoate--beta-alanine ligase
MYAADATTRIMAGPFGEKLCGRFRPCHFDGVCTVVCKLLNIVHPHRAYFGEKDYQQLVIIRRMVRDLNIPVEIVGCPTVRQPDGLALSSRNRYLSDTSRNNAAAIFAAMTEAASRIKQGSRDARPLCDQMRTRLIEAGATSVDYASIVDPRTLDDVPIVDRAVRICVAARFDGARLIDNLAVDDLPPAG